MDIAHFKIWGTPLPYLLIRLLFKFVLKVFYSSIVIENSHFIPPDGTPCILCVNHSNSLTDALITITSVPLSKRKWIRMTAKSTLFGLRTFSSWLIESVGTLPVKRPWDMPGKKVDNTAVFETLMQAIEKNGDMVCMFPEGISHYSPGLAPLKSGVARMTSDILRRNKDNPDFKLVLLTCSITYLHREAFRSDVLVCYNPPIELTIKDHYALFSSSVKSDTGSDVPTSIVKVEPTSPATEMTANAPVLDGVKQLTQLLYEQIRQSTIDSPDFATVRIANTARRLYAPLGTQMTLGDHVHITQRFVDVFARNHLPAPLPSVSADALLTPLPLPPTTPSKAESTLAIEENGLKVQAKTAAPEGEYFGLKRRTNGLEKKVTDQEIEQLKLDLHAYQDLLNHLGLKDDRVRQTPPEKRVLVKRLFVRLAGAAALFLLAAPGLIFWTPVFVTAGFFGWRAGSSGKLRDVWDGVAHTKLIYGLLSGTIVWLLVTLVTFPLSGLTFFIFPFFMWFSLRWLEDCLSSLRAAIALLSMLAIGKSRLREIRKMRQELYERVKRVAVERAELPEDIEVFVREAKERRAKERGGKVGRLGYFSLRRRRKKDYNELMYLWDQSEYAM
ncbi:hypothetical protein P389DRAFT_21761 [Cystobasidium minutum MCA 4210]|uniref:uncharacterized protein n=1 Tax=Cystobasidium minutum MCA 4210 TaxID=1397322 RepID=UPI0034CFC7AB|eukprot:jgi/Rhomi1/21761/CE21760_1958